MLFQTCLKGYKLEKLFVEQKTAKLAKSGEPYEQ